MERPIIVIDINFWRDENIIHKQYDALRRSTKIEKLATQMEKLKLTTPDTQLSQWFPTDLSRQKRKIHLPIA